MKTDWEVTVPVTISLSAESREEAVNTVIQWIEDYVINLEHVGTPRAHNKWQPVAKDMLEDGMSYNEVARTLGITRQHISRQLPGYGWSKNTALEYRELKKKMQEATL